MWVRSFETIEDLRLALLAFKRTYNEQWMLAKYDYRSPAQVRRDFDGLDAAALITFKPLSKNPGALHFQPDSVEAVPSTSAERPMWRVTFRGRLPGQPAGLFETIIVEVDSSSGEVVSVSRT